MPIFIQFCTHSSGVDGNRPENSVGFARIPRAAITPSHSIFSNILSASSRDLQSPFAINGIDIDCLISRRKSLFDGSLIFWVGVRPCTARNVTPHFSNCRHKLIVLLRNGRNFLVNVYDSIIRTHLNGCCTLNLTETLNDSDTFRLIVDVMSCKSSGLFNIALP